ncbi:MAG: RNA methyltransferase, partial [Thermodesulfobacteriota bacterium]
MKEEEIRACLAKVAIVLVEPKYPENIGAAARSAMNMGISRLIVVRNEDPDREAMLRMATHNAAHLIENMQIFRALEPALEPFSLVVGTTARQGRQRRPPNTPRAMVEKLLPLLAENQVAILFGPEHRGLTNDDLKF